MPKRYRIELSDEVRERLERWSRNPPKPYLRERARALLRVAAGEPASAIGQSLRVPVHRTTVGEWVKRFQTEGVRGLYIKPGRGRKPVFSPSDPSRGAGAD